MNTQKEPVEEMKDLVIENIIAKNQEDPVFKPLWREEGNFFFFD